MADRRGPGWRELERRWGDLQAAPEAWLDALFAVRPAELHRRLPGRETATWQLPSGSSSAGDPGAPATRVVLKRFRGDSARDVWFERLHRGRARSPARREAENLAALRALGFPVPEPLAWVAEPGRGGRSALVMERCSHRATLEEVLAGAAPAAARRWVEPLATLVARLHAAGWYHRDLYLAHWILLDSEPARPVPPTSDLHLSPPQPLALLDLGRARHQARVRARWFVKDLAALAHSLSGAVPAPGPRERRLELRFLRTYLASRSNAGKPATGSLRSWARRVEQKRRRLAAHAPRFAFDSAALAPAGSTTSDANPKAH